VPGAGLGAWGALLIQKGPCLRRAPAVAVVERDEQLPRDVPGEPVRQDARRLRVEEVLRKKETEKRVSSSSPLEQTRSKLANPVEVTGFDRG